MRVTTFVCALCLVGCAGGEQVGSRSETSSSAGLADTDRRDEPGATRASREARRQTVDDGSSPATEPSGSTAPSPPSAPAPPDTPLLSVHPIDVDEAEDGRGARIEAERPVAFDVDGRRFPPRAPDPVLHVGELRFHAYVYPRPGVLRFVAADRDALPEGEPLFIQYGDDERTRVQLAPSLAQVP